MRRWKKFLVIVLLFGNMGGVRLVSRTHACKPTRFVANAPRSFKAIARKVFKVERDRSHRRRLGSGRYGRISKDLEALRTADKVAPVQVHAPTVRPVEVFMPRPRASLLVKLPIDLSPVQPLDLTSKE